MTGLLSPTAGTTTRRATFHPLTVAKVERLTPEATAITFAVPDDLAEAYRFAPGQHLTRAAQGLRLRRLRAPRLTPDA